jgi:hypothetical protein
MDNITEIVQIVVSEPEFYWLLFGLLLVSFGGLLNLLLGKPKKTARPEKNKYDGGLTKDSNPRYKSQYIPRD